MRRVRDAGNIWHPLKGSRQDLYEYTIFFHLFLFFMELGISLPSDHVSVKCHTALGRLCLPSMLLPLEALFELGNPGREAVICSLVFCKGFGV